MEQKIQFQRVKNYIKTKQEQYEDASWMKDVKEQLEEEDDMRISQERNKHQLVHQFQRASNMRKSTLRPNIKPWLLYTNQLWILSGIDT